MLYPGTGEQDRRKARAFASHYLAEPVRQFLDAGGTLSNAALGDILTAGGARLDDLDDRWWAATATGQMFKTYFALSKTMPDLASWNNAGRLAEVIAAREKQSGSRSALWDALRRFKAAAHLWGAWCIREGKFSASPEVGYELWDDFQCFLAEAEILRKWGQSWRAPRGKSEPPLPAEVWHVPRDWRPPERKPGWPMKGMIPKLTIPDELLAKLRKAGRPRKSF